MNLYQRIFEADERIRRLQRKAAGDDPEVEESHHRALIRAGRGHEVFGDELKKWAGHRNDLRRADDNDPQLSHHRGSMESVGKSLRARAKKLGALKTLGRHLSPEHFDSRHDHMSALADLHGGVWDHHETRLGASFHNKAHADAFKHAAQYHYPGHEVRSRTRPYYSTGEIHDVSISHDPKGS